MSEDGIKAADYPLVEDLVAEIKRRFDSCKMPIWLFGLEGEQLGLLLHPNPLDKATRMEAL